MSNPRIKRQFAGAAIDPAQRQITAFFPCTASGSKLTTPGASDNRLPIRARAVLPSETQENLLSVGMRVRKSVPEGYKTGSYSAFSLWTNNDPPTSEQAPPTALTPVPPASSPPNSQQELLPFCGLNKVGGLSFPSLIQHPSTSRLSQRDSVPGIDDLPSLTGSQESVESSTSSPPVLPSNGTAPPTRKRTYSEDMDGNTPSPSITGSLQTHGSPCKDGGLSPRALMPVDWDTSRVMAVPRKRWRAHKAAASGLLPSFSMDTKSLAAEIPASLHLEQLGQESRMAHDDFQDADFLDYNALDNGVSMEL